MVNMSITDDISKYLQGVINQYGTDVKDTVEDVIKDVTKDSLKKVKDKSPKRRGVYAKGWRQSVTVGKYTIEGIIYGSKPSTYAVAHLLENGYVTRSGTRVRPFTHLLPVFEEAQKTIIKKLEERL